MTAQEAYRNFTQNKPNRVVMSCYEYDTCFVFHAVPPKYATPILAAQVFDSAYAVSKINGSISVFDPLKMSAEEYSRGRRLPIYDSE